MNAKKYQQGSFTYVEYHVGNSPQLCYWNYRVCKVSRIWWPPMTSMKNKRFLALIEFDLYNKFDLYKSMNNVIQVFLWRYHWVYSFQTFTSWPQITFDEKQIPFCTFYKGSVFKVQALLLKFTMFSDLDLSRPQMTFDHCRSIYVPHMKLSHHVLFKLESLQAARRYVLFWEIDKPTKYKQTHQSTPWLEFKPHWFSAPILLPFWNGNIRNKHWTVIAMEELLVICNWTNKTYSMSAVQTPKKVFSISALLPPSILRQVDN